MRLPCCEVRKALPQLQFGKLPPRASYEDILTHLKECDKCCNTLATIDNRIAEEIGNPLEEVGADKFDVTRLRIERKSLIAAFFLAEPSAAITVDIRKSREKRCQDNKIFRVRNKGKTLRQKNFPCPIAIFAPMHYEPGYSYPLIIWLHGPSSDERQLMRIMPVVSMRNYVGIAPRGLSLGSPVQGGAEKFGWPQSEEDEWEAEQRVFGSIDVARRKLHVNQRRIFIAGFDRGGTTALRLAMNRPECFAGVVSCGGALPTARPLGNLIAARRLSMFLASGRSSAEYPVKTVVDEIRLLHSAGMNVTLRQYPCGHELTPQMLGDMDRWITEQITEPKVMTTGTE